MKIVLNLDDFNISNTFEELLLSSFIVFVILWLIEGFAYVIYTLLPGEIFATKRNKIILARHTMDFISMIMFSYLGYQAFCIVGFDVYASLKVFLCILHNVLLLLLLIHG